MQNLVLAIKFLISFSLIGYLRSKSHPSSISLNNLNQFWRRWLRTSKPAKDHILVDALLFHPSYLANNFTLTNFLRRTNNANVTSLVMFSSDQATKQLSKSFCIDKFAYCYEPFNISVIINAFIRTAIIAPRLSYSKYIGIPIVVDGMDIGEYIYDEYLRVTNTPTKRSVSIDYVMFVYRSLYLYFRYRQIFAKYEITKVVFGHNIYATWGLLLPAAKAEDRNILFYNWFDTTRSGKISVTTQLPSAKVRKPGYMKIEYMDLLKDKYGDQQIIQRFESLMLEKMAGQGLDAYSANAYTSAEVTDIDSFVSQYSMPERTQHVFIYSHAFVDAVKYARWTIYSDYFTWLEETLLRLVEKSRRINIYVKPHPSDHLYGCRITSRMLVERINQQRNASFIYLDKKVSNAVVFAIADSIVTCCGSVNIEASCYGVPVVLAGEYGNELIGYTRVCRTEKEYLETLAGCESLPRLSDDQVRAAKIYYCWYMELMFVRNKLFSGGSIFAVEEDTVTAELRHLDSLYEDIKGDEMDNMLAALAGVSGTSVGDVI